MEIKVIVVDNSPELKERLTSILSAMEGVRFLKSFDDAVAAMQYVEENLANPNLTLKWIAENYLFMNVDYVSKRFIRETDQKFSNYLSNLRIQRARQLLSEGRGEIQWVAQQVGCGNNPQYFSQIFKKSTGLTPSAFVKKINGGQ